MRIPIGKRMIGDGEPVFIIAEAGSNHNGSFPQAIRLIDVAAEAGADAVKFQNFKAERLYPRGAGESDYLKIKRPIYDIIEEMEMPEEWVPELARYCAEKAVEFLSSPFDEDAADLLAPHVPAFKIASYEMTHTPLLRHIARFGKPVIVSTGTATLEEVEHVVEILNNQGAHQIVLLQCTAAYPTPPEAVNARAMVTLRQATGCLVGLSDHSRDPVTAPIVATALGACVIEKHFTLSNRLPGPDHAFAIEPAELHQLVRGVRGAESTLGHGKKETLDVEEELRAFARRSVFAVQHISAGDLLTSENIAILRGGKLPAGVTPDAFDELLGRRASRDIAAEAPLDWSDVR